MHTLKFSIALATLGYDHMPKVNYLFVPNNVFTSVIVKFVRVIFVLTFLVTKFTSHGMFSLMNGYFLSKVQMQMMIKLIAQCPIITSAY